MIRDPDYKPDPRKEPAPDIRKQIVETIEQGLTCPVEQPSRHRQGIMPSGLPAVPQPGSSCCLSSDDPITAEVKAE